MASSYAISMVRLDGKRVLLKPNGHAERDLVVAIENAILARVGWFCTKGQLRQAIREAVPDVLMAVRTDVIPEAP